MYSQRDKEWYGMPLLDTARCRRIMLKDLQSMMEARDSGVSGHEMPGLGLGIDYEKVSSKSCMGPNLSLLPRPDGYSNTRQEG